MNNRTKYLVCICIGPPVIGLAVGVLLGAVAYAIFGLTGVLDHSASMLAIWILSAFGFFIGLVLAWKHFVAAKKVFTETQLGQDDNEV